MILIWGKKEIQKKIGFRAEFCPICRNVKAHHAKELREVSHLYYVPLGRGEKRAYRVTCQECKVDYYDTESEHLDTNRYADPLTDLIRDTNPEMVEELSDRMRMEGQIVENPMSLEAEAREELIVEPILHLAGSLEVDAKGPTKIDGFMLKCLAGWVGYVFVILSLTPWLGTLRPLNRQLKQLGVELIVAVTISIVLAAIALLIWCLVTGKKRYLDNHIYPLLVKALRPLQPSREELTDAIYYIREMELEIGKVDPEKLAKLIEETVWTAGQA